MSRVKLLKLGCHFYTRVEGAREIKCFSNDFKAFSRDSIVVISRVYGARNRFPVPSRANENFRSLKRLIIFLPKTTDRRRPVERVLPLPRAPSDPQTSFFSPGFPVPRSVVVPTREWDSGWDPGVDKIDKLSA